LEELAIGAGEPFFVWLNTSRMHLYTRIEDEWLQKAEQYTLEGDYHGAGMLQHDHDIGTVLDWLEANGLADNTIVLYSTDNGPEHASWPHGGTTPFRGEKLTPYEGGVRVPAMVREKKQYIDGLDNLDYWMGTADGSSRTHIFHYYESKLTAVHLTVAADESNIEGERTWESPKV